MACSFFLSIFIKVAIEMKPLVYPALLAFVTLTGCASVPMESPENDSMAKQFAPPSPGNAGLYIYRAGGPGASLKKDIWVDGKCIGESAPNVYFYQEVSGGQDHEIATESEFSPNTMTLMTEAGENYFVNQYIKMGLFVGGANVKRVEDEKGKEMVSRLRRAINGHCSKSLQ